MSKEFLIGVAVLCSLDLVFQIWGYIRYKKESKREA